MTPSVKNRKNYCTFYIVRHGETDYNVQHIIQGHIDSNLTGKGIIQAQELARELRNIHFDAIYSSDLLRARKTAEIIGSEHKLAVQTTKLIRERNYGIFEGKPGSTLYQFNKLVEKMSEEENFRYKIDESMESDEEVVTRLITFLREAAIANPGKTILMVTHGGMMRVFLNHIGFGDFRYFRTSYISNTAYMKLISDGVDFFVEETKGIKREGK